MLYMRLWFLVESWSWWITLSVLKRLKIVWTKTRIWLRILKLVGAWLVWLKINVVVSWFLPFVWRIFCWSVKDIVYCRRRYNWSLLLRWRRNCLVRMSRYYVVNIVHWIRRKRIKIWQLIIVLCLNISRIWWPTTTKMVLISMVGVLSSLWSLTHHGIIDIIVLVVVPLLHAWRRRLQNNLR